MGISTCMSVPLAPKPHGEVLMDPDGCLHAVGCITGKNPKSFIVDNKHVYPWFRGVGHYLCLPTVFASCGQLLSCVQLFVVP